MSQNHPVSLSGKSSSISVVVAMTRLLGRLCLYAVFTILSVAIIMSLAAEASEPEAEDLMSMNIEDLMTMEVTSVSKQAEKMIGASAAIFVITAEDIRRSGAHNIPEALRMVPGMQVSRMDNNNYAVSARGFNDIFSNKLLVLIDGRSVYTPSFSGVFWSTQDLVLADIDRIEVIRGPGATLWGANAVGGVVNVITRNAAETRGSLAEVSVGSKTERIVSLRHGVEVKPNLHFRTHFKYRTQDASTAVPGAMDESEHVRGGIRLDWIRDTENSVSLQADLYSGEIGNVHPVPEVVPPYNALMGNIDEQGGGHILVRWDHQDESGSNMSLQAYYDVDDRTSYGQGIENKTFDVEFQHDFAFMDVVRATWGLGYRTIEDTYVDSPTLFLDPLTRSADLISGFVQGELSLLEDRAKVTVGSKFEDNDFTGFEVQPNIRVSYLKDDLAIWGSVARAVRTPSRMEHGFAVSIATIPPFTPGNPGALPILMQIQGNENLAAEELTAFEAGVRKALTDNLWIDATAYHDRYDGIVSTIAGTPAFNPGPPVPHLIFPLTLGNNRDIDVNGFELASTWRAAEATTLKFAYTHTETSAKTGSSEKYQGPTNQASVRASFDVTDRIDLDIWGRWVDEISSLDVDAYGDLDIRLGYRVSDRAELSLTGKNLIDDERWETAPNESGFVNTPAERTIFLTLRLAIGS